MGRPCTDAHPRAAHCASPGVLISAPSRSMLAEFLTFETVLYGAFSLPSDWEWRPGPPVPGCPSLRLGCVPAVSTWDGTPGPLCPAQPASAPGQPLPETTPTTCHPSHLPPPCDLTLISRSLPPAAWGPGSHWGPCPGSREGPEGDTQESAVTPEPWQFWCFPRWEGPWLLSVCTPHPQIQALPDPAPWRSWQEMGQEQNEVQYPRPAQHPLLLPLTRHLDVAVAPAAAGLGAPVPRVSPCPARFHK